MPIKETVTYYVRLPQDAFDDGVTVPQVESRPMSQQEVRSAELSHESENRTFHMWTEKLSEIEPKIADKFEDESGSMWHIAKWDLELAGARYRLLCFKGIV